MCVICLFLLQKHAMTVWLIHTIGLASFQILGYNVDKNKEEDRGI